MPSPTGGPHPATYVTLDDLTRLAAARRDPPGFVRSLPGAVVLDEIQRAPDLLLAIKREVDRDRRPGRFLLTGSANVLLLPGIADTLAGRMEIHNIGKRLARAPKAFLTDTGLMLYLLGIDPERLATDPQITGPLLETFVATELYRGENWLPFGPKMYALPVSAIWRLGAQEAASK